LKSLKNRYFAVFCHTSVGSMLPVLLPTVWMDVRTTLFLTERSEDSLVCYPMEIFRLLFRFFEDFFEILQLSKWEYLNDFPSPVYLCICGIFKLSMLHLLI
jgi:hypothetical protein